MANAALARNGVDSDWVLRQTAPTRRIYATEASHSPRSPTVAAAVASHAAPLWRQLAWFIMPCTYGALSAYKYSRPIPNTPTIMDLQRNPNCVETYATSPTSEAHYSLGIQGLMRSCRRSDRLHPQSNVRLTLPAGPRYKTRWPSTYRDLQLKTIPLHVKRSDPSSSTVQESLPQIHSFSLMKPTLAVPTYVIRAHKSLETLDTNNQGPMLVRPYIKLNAYESKGRGSKRTEAKKLLNCRVWSRYTPAMYLEASEALVPVGCRGAPTSRYLAATPVYFRQVSSDIWSYESSTNLSNDVTNHERRHNTVVIWVSRERAFTPEARHAVGLQGQNAPHYSSNLISRELDLIAPGGMRLLERGRTVALLRNHREYTPSITPRYTASEIWSRQATFWIGVEICQKSTPPVFSAKPLMPPTPKKLLRRARCAGFQLGPRRFSPRIHVDSPATPGELAAADGPGPATAVDAASGSLLFPEHRNSETESFSGLIVYCKGWVQRFGASSDGTILYIRRLCRKYAAH
ncbi:hypothetical protein C8R46DRAFT_1042092 [Mycena filopes]|nr:hypothetical protein C8R46DRAFT_1042092 [Mycena filopes]